MRDLDKLLIILREKLLKALAHLKYSYEKVTVLPTQPNLLNEESLEVWESFAIRFARVADLFLAQYLRTRVLQADPAFSGTFRDVLNQAEKMELIKNSTEWLEIRALRNVIEHEYTDDDLAAFFQAIKEHAPLLLALKEQL